MTFTRFAICFHGWRAVCGLEGRREIRRNEGKEFAREDERRVLIALDPFVAARPYRRRVASPERRGEIRARGIVLRVSGMAFPVELESVIGFRTPVDKFRGPRSGKYLSTCCSS